MVTRENFQNITRTHKYRNARASSYDFIYLFLLLRTSALVMTGKFVAYAGFAESYAALNYTRSISHMSSGSEPEGTDLERKVSVRASRLLSLKRKTSSDLGKPTPVKDVSAKFSCINFFVPCIFILCFQHHTDMKI